jgi:hypothetical protein
MTRNGLIMGWLGVLAFALPAVADAPPNRYTYPAAGTVYDTRTKLTWQQAAPDASYTQSAADSYCRSLMLAGGGWRLPTRAELLTIVDPTKAWPALDGTAFPATPPELWTSSPALSAPPDYVWYVEFSAGTTSVSFTNVSKGVRCVR